MLANAGICMMVFIVENGENLATFSKVEIARKKKIRTKKHL